jgi:hypothetical protein
MYNRSYYSGVIEISPAHSPYTRIISIKVQFFKDIQRRPKNILENFYF